jgi:hypothetical protein
MRILSVPRQCRSRVLSMAAAAATAALAASPGRVLAQTDFYNTDEARPVRIEDAYPTERYAFELQLAPLRLERSPGGVYTWEIEPEVAYGIFPRTHVEVGFPIAFVDAGGEGQEEGLAGISISALHNLNVETAFPAFGVAADVLLPVGGLAPDGAYASVKGIATRTYSWARFHVNAAYTLGAEPDAGESAGEASRWMAGLAVDRTFPLRSTLLTADVFVEQPLDDDADLEWTVEAGLRRQVSPVLAFDAGVGRRLTGDDQGWFVTIGSAYAFGIRSLIPVGRR